MGIESSWCEMSKAGDHLLDSQSNHFQGSGSEMSQDDQGSLQVSEAHQSKCYYQGSSSEVSDYHHGKTEMPSRSDVAHDPMMQAGDHICHSNSSNQLFQGSISEVSAMNQRSSSQVSEANQP